MWSCIFLKKFNKRCLQLFSFLFILLCINFSLYAKQANSSDQLSCSSSQPGAGVINEINTQDNFVELYLLLESDMSDWQIKIDPSSNGQAATVINVSSCASSEIAIAGNNFSAGTFFACDISMNPSNDEVVLVDATDSVIDYLGYGKLTPTAVWDVPFECGALYPEHSASNKDIARLPDGTGELIDNASNSTKGTTNGGSGGGGGTTEELAEKFNCIETSSASLGTKQIYTKLSGVDFNLDIVALKNNGNLVNKYKKAVTVEIIDQITGDSLVIDTAFQFDEADDSRKLFAVSLGNKAYSNLICKVTYIPNENANENSHVIAWSDNFSVRPANFLSISSSMNNATSGAGTTAKAGADLFTITASTEVEGYTGTPKYNSILKDHNNVDQENKLSGDFSAANEPSLSAIGTNFLYKEVGLLRFAVNDIYDDSFTAVDQSSDCTDDFSNSLVNGKYGCKFGNEAEFVIGRFTPDHFIITESTEGSFSNTCDSGNFTYNGEQFTYQTKPTLTVTAFNGLTPAEVTKNYSGDYAKLQLTDFTIDSVTEDASQLGGDNTIKVKLDRVAGSATLVTNGDGALSYTLGDDAYSYQREANSKIDKFDNQVDLKFSSITDSDLIATQDLPFALSSTGANIRFGRLSMDNSHGSELRFLNSPIYTEYFNGSVFITNTDDNCTVINLSQLRFNHAINPITVADGNATASIINSPVSTGQVGLTFTAPGEGNTGSIDISVNDLFEWLQFDWDGNGNHDNSPTARATFGIYKGNQKQIYFREVY